MRIIRILSTVVILGALAWSGWWYALSRGQEAALAAWFDDRARAGWQAETEDIGLTGFPLRLERRITGIRLADPKTGWAWTAPWLEFASATYAPNRVDVTLPDAQTLAVPGELAEITSETMTARLGLYADTDLGLIDASARVGGLDIRARSGWTARAGNVAAEIAERVNDDGYTLDFRAEKVLMPEPWMARIDPLGVAGRELERVTFDGSAVFDAPLDRHVIEDGRLALKIAVIRRTGFQWGQMRLEAKGKIKVDDRGYPKGKIDLTMRHWREIIAMARRSGVIGPEIAEALTTALELAAMLGGNRDELDATLKFKDGEVWIGPISIGRAPRLAPPRG
jgi:hypothetical protein